MSRSKSFSSKMAVWSKRLSSMLHIQKVQIRSHGRVDEQWEVLINPSGCPGEGKMTLMRRQREMHEFENGCLVHSRDIAAHVKCGKFW
jgi:hypothetical protein